MTFFLLFCFLTTTKTSIDGKRLAELFLFMTSSRREEWFFDGVLRSFIPHTLHSLETGEGVFGSAGRFLLLLFFACFVLQVSFFGGGLSRPESVEGISVVVVVVVYFRSISLTLFSSGTSSFFFSLLFARFGCSASPDLLEGANLRGEVGGTVDVGYPSCP